MSKPKMIRRVVTQNVTVVREGKRVTPEMNKAFDFTADEIEYLDRVSPAASRRAVNESPADAALEDPEGGDTGTDETAPDGNKKPTANKAPKRGGKKAAPAKEEPEDESEDESEDADESEDDDI